MGTGRRAQARRDIRGLMAEHGASVYAAAVSIVSPALAEGVVREVFLVASLAPASVRTEWSRVRADLVLRTVRRAAEVVAGVSDGPDDLRAAILDLPAAEREPLVLALTAGVTSGDIARALDSSVATARARIRAGLAKLEAAVSDLGAMSQLTPT